MVKDWLFVNIFEGEDDAFVKSEAIIKALGSHALTLSHDRHLAPDQSKDLGLKIIDLEDDQDLQDKVLSLQHSFIIALTPTPANKIIENSNIKALI